MRALYDLGKYLTSFNFFEWLVQAEAKGATKVVFDIRGIRGDKWPTTQAVKRFWSICAPGPALIGLPHETFTPDMIGATQARNIAQPGGKAMVDFWNSARTFKRLRTVRPAKAERYTVTLRKTARAPLRDSDEDAWRDFAKEIGAFVIPDYDEKAIHLHERVALYAGAEMNFFVSNGPGVLCSMTEYPCMLFETNKAKGSFIADGLQEFDQYPWMVKNQRAIWEDATPESLRRHFEYWKSTGEFLDVERGEPSEA